MKTTKKKKFTGVTSSKLTEGNAARSIERSEGLGLGRSATHSVWNGMNEENEKRETF